MAEKVPLHIVAVTGIVIKDHKFLAGRRSQKEIAFPGLWSVPGGKVELGKSIELTLRREIREEVGVAVGEVFYVGDFSFVRADGHPVVGKV